MTDSGIDKTYGAAFVGLVAAATFYGITILQTFLYYKNYSKDRLFLKTLVFLLWILDTAHLIFCTMALYWYLITNFSDKDTLMKNIWSMEIQTDFNGLIGLIVQCFFAKRVWTVSRNAFLTVIIVVLSISHFAFGIVFTVSSVMLGTPFKWVELTWITATGLGSAAACDFLIAVSLCYYLLKSRTGFAATDSLLTTLTIYSLTTGLLTSITAFICVITFAVLPDTYVWLAFFWVLGKFHVNSLLATLNSRDTLRKIGLKREGTFHQLSVLSGHPPQPNSPRAVGFAFPRLPSRVDIEVCTATVSKTDYYLPDAKSSGDHVGVSSM